MNDTLLRSTRFQSSLANAITVQRSIFFERLDRRLRFTGRRRNANGRSIQRQCEEEEEKEAARQIVFQSARAQRSWRTSVRREVARPTGPVRRKGGALKVRRNSAIPQDRPEFVRNANVTRHKRLRQKRRDVGNSFVISHFVLFSRSSYCFLADYCVMKRDRMR